MANRIAVMNEGQLQAYATPDELYDRPPTLFIAGFVGNPPMNLLSVEITRENGIYHARSEGFDVVVPVDRGEKAIGKGKVIMGIRPEDVAVSEDGIPGEIYVVEPLGRDDLIDVRVGNAEVRVLADPGLGLKMREAITLDFNADKLQFFDPETEQSMLW